MFDIYDNVGLYVKCHELHPIRAFECKESGFYNKRDNTDHDSLVLVILCFRDDKVFSFSLKRKIRVQVFV